ncbi:SH3 domain-containing protein [Belnapia sp. T6]|uniref:SH3 domain-containing protein n=1 Tax=Belnapia mucosa TaxID=2804532 RepID=A0ABS1V8U9_9PROT|nr:SH3 domain-containing protein [Belnapia mucosa]MBL6458094.1 SH3 domain-containing protein [Belnapia mucosa]
MSDHSEAQYRLDTAPELPGGMVAEVPEGWLSLEGCSLQSRPIDAAPGPAIAVPLVLMHPEFGLAILGLEPVQAEAAEAALRERLEAARFGAIFPGHLPVVSLNLMPGDPFNLQRRLATAFAAQPPLELAGGDGWVTVVRRLLLTHPPVRSSAMLRPMVRAPMLPEPEEPVRAPRFALGTLPWPLLGLTAAGLVVGLALGLSHRPQETNTGAEAPPQPATSAPPPVVAAAPARVAEQRATAPAAPARVAEQRAAAPAAPAASPAPMPAPAAPVTPAAAPAANLPRVLVRTAANIRNGPDTGARVLRTAPRGESFRVHGEARGGWVQVGDAAPEGWIHSSLLTEP